MTWPAWIDELGRRYLAGEGNVFVLHGAPLNSEVMHDGVPVDLPTLLTRFLARTRAVVGHHSAARGVVFPELGDQNTFERILGAQNILSGRTDVLRSRDALQALARIHRAAGDPAVAQAYLLLQPDALFPAGRRRLTEIPERTPLFPQWNAHLASTNNLVLLLVENLSQLHPVAHEGLPRVHIRAERSPALQEAVAPPPVSTPTATQPPPAPATTPPPPRPPAAARRADASAVPDPADLLPTALEKAFLAHDSSTWPSKLPVLAAVADVIHQLAPTQCGPLSFALDEDGKPTAAGPGADWFLSAWRGDIALDASAGMMVKELQQTPGGLALEPTALRALTRRTIKLLKGLSS